MDDVHREHAIAELTARITSLERRTTDDVAALRAELQAVEAAAHVPWQSETKPARPAAARPQHDLSWLVGPRGFALAGGVVTLLGLAFLFALASSRGWVGPGMRCVFGVALSLCLIGVGVAVKRRFANDVSARAAVGTGIAGLYLSLFAATSLYHLVPQELAWPAVVAVGALAVGFALAWSSQMLASLGLVTSAVAPPLLAGELTAREVGAAAIATIAALVVGQARSWRFVGLATYAVGFAQALLYLADARPYDVSGAIVAVVFFEVALLGAVGYQRHATRLSGAAAALASSTLPLALLAMHQLVGAPESESLFSGTGQVVALALLALAYAAPAVLLWRSPRTRELGELLAVLALTAAGLATATALSGGTLVVAWTLVGVALAVLAARTTNPRYYAPAAAYWSLALVHVLRFDEPLRRLFVVEPSPARHLGPLIVVTLGAGAVAWLLHDRREPVAHARRVATAVAGTLAVYALSLVLLQAAEATPGQLDFTFQRGQTMISALWALVGLALVGLGLARGWVAAKNGGLALLGIALGKLFLFDLGQLSSLARVASFLSVGLAFLCVAFVVQRLAVRSS